MTESFWTKSTPIAVGVRTAMWVLATSPVVIGLINNVGAFEDLRQGLIPALVVLLNAILAGVVAGLLRLSSAFQAKVQTPGARAVVQGIEHFVTGMAAISFAGATWAEAVAVGESLGTLLVASIMSALAALVVNGAENRPEHTVR